jgi:flagellar hook assembly protein FlgD
LHQNYPNPFNPATRIQYAVSREKRRTADNSLPHTTLKIYNILGQKVRTLVDESKRAGSYEVIWDGKDDKGKEVGSGIYFYQLRAGDYTETKKMILVK